MHILSNMWALLNDHYRQTYDDEHQGEDVRHGFEPAQVRPEHQSDDRDEDDSGENNRDRGGGDIPFGMADDRNVWKSSP